MSELSPAAQAVLDAYNAGFRRPVAVHHKPRIAAALRAAAYEIDWESEDPRFLLENVAAELENHQ